MTESTIPALPSRLRLERPLVVFDLEATGLNKRTDRIVSIALVRYEPSGSVEQVNYLLNPGIPIPEDSTAIHGITDADVAGAPTFAEMAEALAQATGDELRHPEMQRRCQQAGRIRGFGEIERVFLIHEINHPLCSTMNSG